MFTIRPMSQNTESRSTRPRLVLPGGGHDRDEAAAHLPLARRQSMRWQAMPCPEASAPPPHIAMRATPERQAASALPAQHAHAERQRLLPAGMGQFIDEALVAERGIAMGIAAIARGRQRQAGRDVIDRLFRNAIERQSPSQASGSARPRSLPARRARHGHAAAAGRI
jgi:hypothetical protein